ncbi:MAG: CDP-glucose 4,6-dehydratase [Agriterribacter sp.]
MEKMVNKNTLTSYYKNKKVFVTGHTGFKGAWLVSLLRELGAEIKGYALPPEYYEELLSDEIFQNKIISVFADIRDKRKLEEELKSFQPDYVFHLAAQPLVRRSYQIPAETFEINVAGTANLLEGILCLQKKCVVVVVTTDKVYENKERDVLYSEEDTLGGYDPYSASKACCELLINSFRNSFFNPDNFEKHQKAVASARAGNVIGGGDWSADRIIPDIVRSLADNETVIVRNPHAVRPWQHVLEPLTGYLLLGGLLGEDHHRYSKAYNFGPDANDHLTVKMLVEKAIESWGKGTWKDMSVDNKGQPHEAGLLKLDIAKAKIELGWRPKLDASTAVRWTIDWYKQSNKTDYTLHQINSYLAL